MSSYAKRRDARIAKTLAAIDAVTLTCMVCGKPVPRHGPFDLFCSMSCHYAGLAYSAERRDDTTPRVEINTGTPQRPHWRPLPGAVDIEISPDTTTDDPPVSAEAGLSIVAATIDSMDAVTADIAARADQAAEQQARIDRATHDSHTHEMRGAAAGFIAFIAAVLAVSYLLDASWIAGGFTAVIAAASGWLWWMSWGNARAEAAECRICHPPCDTATTTS